MLITYVLVHKQSSINSSKGSQFLGSERTSLLFWPWNFYRRYQTIFAARKSRVNRYKCYQLLWSGIYTHYNREVSNTHQVECCVSWETKIIKTSTKKHPSTFHFILYLFQDTKLTVLAIHKAAFNIVRTKLVFFLMTGFAQLSFFEMS